MVACALFQSAVERQQALGDYLSSQRGLAMTQDGSAWRVWQIVHRVPTLAHQLEDRLARSSPPAAVAETLVHCAARFLRAWERWRNAGEPLPLALDLIGEEDEKLVYVGPLPEAVHPKACSDPLDALEMELGQRLEELESELDVPAVIVELQSKMAAGTASEPVTEVIRSLLAGHGL
jgi:hypothetical protein